MGFTRNIESEWTVLGKLINRLGLPTNVLSLLFAHAAAVRSSNKRLGLVSPGDEPNIVSRHTADSLLFAAARRPRAEERWLDVGSGAGFPGLVLAAAFPGCMFTLLEPRGRRAGFLDLVVADLGLENVGVDDRRLHDLEGGNFDVAVARALKVPDEALKSMLPTLRPGGDSLVAIGPSDTPEPPARLVVLEGFTFVDSPGRFSMMTRGG